MSFSLILSSELSKKLQTIITALALDIPDDTQKKFIEYLALLVRWNQVYNLTAIRDPNEMLIKHVADSLAIAPYIQDERLIDVGSGAGLPGIVLALVFPQQKWTLLDSNGKKTRFLWQVKASLQLENVDIVHARVESYYPKECFDGVVARAWTTINDMLSATKHLYCKHATLWAMKGKYPEEELALINHPYEVHKLKIPGLMEQRHLICVEMTDQ